VWYCEVFCKRRFPIQLGWKKEKVSKNPQSEGNTELPSEQLAQSKDAGSNPAGAILIENRRRYEY